MRRALAILALAAGLAWGLAASAAEPAAPAKPLRIYMALWRGWEEAAQGFRDYFINQNIPVELIIRDAAQDKNKLKDFVAEAKALRDAVRTCLRRVPLDRKLRLLGIRAGSLVRREDHRPPANATLRVAEPGLFLDTER